MTANEFMGNASFHWHFFLAWCDNAHEDPTDEGFIKWCAGLEL